MGMWSIWMKYSYFLQVWSYWTKLLQLTDLTDSSAVQDLLDFSEHMLSVDASMRLVCGYWLFVFNFFSGSAVISDVSGSTTPVGGLEISRMISQAPRTTTNPREFKKKNRKFVPGKHTSVAKNDLRRGYAQAYIDALNSGNIPFFKKSLLDFCMPDCVLITRNVSPSGMVFPSHVEVPLAYKAILSLLFYNRHWEWTQSPYYTKLL